MKRRFRKTFVTRPRFMVFVAEPATQPSAGMKIDRTVGLDDRSQTKIVGPADHHSIEVFSKVCGVSLTSRPVSSLIARQTRVLFSFTINFSLDLILRIAARACSAPTRQLDDQIVGIINDALSNASRAR